MLRWPCGSSHRDGAHRKRGARRPCPEPSQSSAPARWVRVPGPRPPAGKPVATGCSSRGGSQSRLPSVLSVRDSAKPQCPQPQAKEEACGDCTDHPPPCRPRLRTPYTHCGVKTKSLKGGTVRCLRLTSYLLPVLEGGSRKPRGCHTLHSRRAGRRSPHQLRAPRAWGQAAVTLSGTGAWFPRQRSEASRGQDCRGCCTRPAW